MRKIIQAAAIILALLPSATMAQDFEAGVEAYHRGDYETALKEFRPLAAQGDASAQFGLGLMYWHGEGVTQDYIEAVKWYRLAAEQGYAKAQFTLA